MTAEPHSPTVAVESTVVQLYANAKRERDQATGRDHDHAPSPRGPRRVSSVGTVGVAGRGVPRLCGLPAESQEYGEFSALIRDSRTESRYLGSDSITSVLFDFDS